MLTACLLLLGSVSSPQVERPSLRDVLTQLDLAMDLPVERLEFLPRLTRTESEKDLKAIVDSDPENVDAIVGLGKARLSLGHYGPAVQAFERALRLDSSNVFVQKWLNEVAKPRKRMADLCAARIGKGRKVVEVVPIRKSFWAILTAKEEKSESEWPLFTAPRVVVVAEDGKGIRAVYASKDLVDPRFKKSDSNDLALFARDLDGDKKEELVAFSSSIGASWMPSIAVVFVEKAGKWKPAGLLKSHDPVTTFRQPVTRRTFLRTVTAIGYTVGHVAQPRWGDLYAVAGDKLVNCNSQFPGKFRPYLKQLQTALKSHPDDWELWDYIGRLHRINGRPNDALMADRKALKLITKELTPKLDKTTKDELTLRKAIIQRRIDGPKKASSTPRNATLTLKRADGSKTAKTPAKRKPTVRQTIPR